MEDRITRIVIRNEELKQSKEFSSQVRQFLAQSLRNLFEEHGIFGVEISLEGKTTTAVTPAGINKAEALKYIYAKYGIQPQNIVYFGDEFGPEGNDLAVTSIQGIKIFSSGPVADAVRSVVSLGEGVNFTELALTTINAFIKDNGLKDLSYFLNSQDFINSIRYRGNSFYPMSIPQSLQRAAEEHFGENWQSEAIGIKGFRLKLSTFLDHRKLRQRLLPGA